MRLETIPKSDGTKVVIGTRTYLGPDWIHVDIDKSKLYNPLDDTWHDVDIVCDAKNISLPDNYADIVFSSECLEHFSWKEYFHILKEWCRILKPGGLIRVEVPDFLAACRQILETNSLDGDRAMQQIFFAEQLNQYDYHYCGITHRMLIDDFEKLGMSVVDVLEGSNWGWLKVDAEKPIMRKNYLLKIDATKTSGRKKIDNHSDQEYVVRLDFFKCLQASRHEWVNGVLSQEEKQLSKLQKLTEDIDTFGIKEPLDACLDRSSGLLTLCDGHHRLMVASRLNITTLPVKIKFAKTHLDHGVLLTEEEMENILSKCDSKKISMI